MFWYVSNRSYSNRIQGTSPSDASTNNRVVSAKSQIYNICLCLLNCAAKILILLYFSTQQLMFVAMLINIIIGIYRLIVVRNLHYRIFSDE
ncbi:hypothetical protein BLOT_009306 [Blomia tropicalis]|nr:hypothetical protein BLOT_009306 [Blomia tropicalis]